MAKKKQSFKASIKKTLKGAKYWFVKDENGRINQTGRVGFEFFLFLPLVIYEGIKVGLYSKIATTDIGFQIITDGVVMPIWKIQALKNATPETGFNINHSGFDGRYLFLFLFAYSVVFAIAFMAAERNKNKSYNKDGDMKFGKISEFNEKMAYCDESGEPCEPPENSYEPGNMILSKNVRYSLEPKGTNTYSCALVIGATGCVDKDTEYFNGTEWKKISEYEEGEKVLQFNTDTNEASLTLPEAYIKEPCDTMYHFETKYGINQTLSPDHRVVYYSKKRPDKAQIITAEELKEKQNSGKFHGRFKTDFIYSGAGIDLSDVEIKIMLAVIADGTFDKNNPNSRRVTLNLKKERKIEQIRNLLKEALIEYKEKYMWNGYVRFTFNAPRREKKFESYWYNCSKEQLELICENVLQWDGSVDKFGRKVSSSNVKANADFVQFAFSACGYRASIIETERRGKAYKTNDKYYTRQSKEYRVSISNRTMVGMEWVNDGRGNNVTIQEVATEDGFKYCFRVPTSALVLRRKGKIFITGNCGKTFTYVKPNILQMNSSYVITDPKGELTSDLGAALMRHGYNVKLFNINEPEYSCKYNPFKYIRCEADVVTAVNVFLENTKEQDAGGGDPFFPLAEKNFYLGLFFYIYTVYKDEPEKQNFKTIYEMYQGADEQEVMLKKGEVAPETPFDKMFRDLAKKDPANPSLGYYATFKKGSYKTRQSILTSVGVKLWFLSVGSIANMMSDDTLELEKIGDRKTALFIIIPSEKKTFKFLSAMLFTQIFETLYYVGNTLNEKSYFVQKGNCIALRSEPFIAGTKSETDAIENLKTKRELWSRAVIEDDNELMKNDPKLKKYFDTPNEYGFKPFPKARLVYTDPESGEKRTLEEFQSREAAEMVYDAICNGEITRGRKSLTNHVRFMLDEFFSLGKIEDFDLKIATFRSLRISCDIIVQSISQLRELYEDREGKITNNCSIQILLGAASLDDCQYFSDQIGQTTVRSESVSVNHKGMIQGVDSTSLSDNAQMLLRPEKIRTLNKDRCLVLVNTMMPIWDDKYSSAKHPRWYESYVSFSEKERKRTKDNQFQFRRLFFIEQDDSNRVITILKDNVQPAIQDDTKYKNKQSIPGHKHPIQGARAGEENNQESTTKVSEEKVPKTCINPDMTNEERNKKYEEAKARQEEAQSNVAGKDANTVVQNMARQYANTDNEIGIADAKELGIDPEALLLAEASRSFETINDNGKTVLTPTKDNVIANALKNNKNIKKDQVFTDESDIFDDLW